MSVVTVGCGDDDEVCRVAGVTYELGESFDDGCRTCVCNDDRSVTCTATPACDMGCEDSDGNQHSIGEFYSAGDACNLCQCVADGEADCTMDPCG